MWLDEEKERGVIEPFGDVLPALAPFRRALPPRTRTWAAWRKLEQMQLAAGAKHEHNGKETLRSLFLSLKCQRSTRAYQGNGRHVQEEQQGKKQEEAPRVAGAGGKGGGAAGEEEGEGKLAEVKAHHSFACARHSSPAARLLPGRLLARWTVCTRALPPFRRESPWASRRRWASTSGARFSS
jgi:hypothetical protein